MQLGDFITMASPVTVHAERCIHSFSPRASCHKCIQVCPSSSISLVNGCISVNACDGCGRCIQVCPHDVFEMEFSEALHTSIEGPLILVCRKHDFSDMPVLQTNCLQQFTWLQLALFVQRFGEVVLYASEKVCEACEFDWFPQGQQLLMQRYGLDAYVEQLHIIRDEDAMRALLEERFPSLNTRREYMVNQIEHIKLAANKYTHQSLESYLGAFHEAMHQEHTLRFEKTQSQAMLLHELYQSIPSCDTGQEIPLQMLTNSRCRFCRTCEKLCPWEAIAVIEENEHAVLAHHDTLCACCGLCLDVCPEHGLHWDHGLTVQDIIKPQWRIIADGSAKKCEHCGERFFPTEKGQDRCAICRNKH